MTAASTGPNIGQPLDHLVAAVTGQPIRGHAAEQRDFGRERASQLWQRGHLPAIGLG
jgi:hypothetical protein